MIEAFRSGIPDNCKPFPDGAKMAKIHWTPKMNQYFPDTSLLGTLHDVDLTVKDSKRFLMSHAIGLAGRRDTSSVERFYNAPKRGCQKGPLAPPQLCVV